MEIQFAGVSKHYKSKIALNNFSATLQSGVYGLLGANGAGKTTLINILVGVLESTNGVISVDGINTKTLGRQFLSQIGYLPQYPQFYKDFEVGEFLLYLCALKGISQPEGKKRITNLLEAVNLSDATKQKIGALSGGMRQRVGIVQALLSDPMLLILDEPTAGLDPQERIRFRNLISRFSKNRIVLLATHIVSDVDAIANQVLILREGVLIKQDTPQRLSAELLGKVWELTLTGEQNLASFDHLQISNLQRNDDEIRLRLLSDTQPHAQAVPVTASLEDVFLYHFGQPERLLHERGAANATAL